MTSLSKKDLEERKSFYKMLLAPTMSLEEKMDELGHLSDEDLTVLLEQFEADENYEICEAIKAVLDEKNLDIKSN
jgi:hypothetical protein